MVPRSAVLYFILCGSCIAQSGHPSVYVYELPANLSDEVIHGVYQESWLYTAGYDFEADLWLHQQVTQSPARTWDPSEAQLFYIPILPTRFLHMTMSESVHWDEAVNKSGEYIREALAVVQQQPYWAIRNGRDHFFALTADYARCIHLNTLPRSVWGDISIVQHLGDLVLRQGGWPCYDPDADILLPTLLPQHVVPLTPVFGKERKISVLYRFGVTSPTSKFTYHTRVIRSELHSQHLHNAIPLSDWSLHNMNETLQDMTNSLFCVCPPGVVAHTSRFWKALRRGCIPVTFFRGYDLPFAGAIDYSAATVNISPDNINTMSSILIDILGDPVKLLSLQRNVERIQQLFVWESQQQTSALEDLFWDEMSKRSASMYQVAA